MPLPPQLGQRTTAAICSEAASWVGEERPEGAEASAGAMVEETAAQTWVATVAEASEHLAEPAAEPVAEPATESRATAPCGRAAALSAGAATGMVAPGSPRNIVIIRWLFSDRHTVAGIGRRDPETFLK